MTSAKLELAIACGNSNRNEMEAMLQAIAHRGPYVSGIHEDDQIILAQNYLQADGAISDNGTKIPVCSPSNPNLMLCYDGQIGNWADLARDHNIPDGPFREERLQYLSSDVLETSSAIASHVGLSGTKKRVFDRWVKQQLRR